MKKENVKKYLNKGYFDVVLNMDVPFMNVFHDKVTQFTTELHPRRTTTYDNTV